MKVVLLLIILRARAHTGHDLTECKQTADCFFVLLAADSKASSFVLHIDMNRYSSLVPFLCLAHLTHVNKKLTAHIFVQTRSYFLRKKSRLSLEFLLRSKFQPPTNYVRREFPASTPVKFVF